MGRAGCGTSLTAMMIALGCIAAGLWRVDGSWAAGFRFVVLSGLAAAVAFFLAAALFETIRERSVWRTLTQHMRDAGVDLETLRQSAEKRAGRVPGATRLAALLKDPPGGPPPA